MSLRSCAFFVVLAFLIIAVVMIFRSSPGLPALPEISITLPSFSLPSLPEMPTLEPLQLTIPTFPISQTTPQPFATPTVTPTATPEPLRNGRLLFLGLDQQVWASDSDGANPVLLGRVADFHVYASTPWYDRLGRYALVTRFEGELEIIYLTPVNNPNAAVRLGPVQRDFDFGGPRDFFAFAPDGKKFLFIDASTDPANLLIVDLDSLQVLMRPIQASAEELSFAAFVGSSSRILIKSFDPNLSAHYLEMYDLGADLTNPRRMLSLQNHRIEQFVPSPDGQWLAVVYRSYDAATSQDRLFMFSFKDNTSVPVLDQPNTKILLSGPAWSPDGRYLLVNSWTIEQPGVFNFLAYDVQQSKSYLLLDSLPSPAAGEPFVRVMTFAPDKLGAGLYLYEARPGGIDYWTVLLDGSYRRQVTQATVQNNQPQGEYISAVSPDWTRLLVVAPDAGAQMGDLYVAALDGSRRERLDGPVPYRFFELGPVISPDGNSVAYLRLDLAGQQAQLCTINLDGSNQRILFGGAQANLESGAPPAGLPLVWLPASPR